MSALRATSQLHLGAVDLQQLRGDNAYLSEVNATLATWTAQARVQWALEHLPAQHALSSSFGAQAAVSLHLLSSAAPTLPVILLDTGYLFPETYQFIEQLSFRLKLNLKRVTAQLSPQELELKHGKLWQQGLAGLDQYNQIVKVEPFQRALKELKCATWFAGLRRSQASTRAQLPVLEIRADRFKVLPIVDWTDREIFLYLKRYDLPYHPLWDQGYLSIGDVHTSRPVGADEDAANTRFFGLKRECGLHQL